MESEILLYLLAMVMGSAQYEPAFVATLVLMFLLVVLTFIGLAGRMNKNAKL